MISLLVPWWGGNPAPLIRTRDSTLGIADEMVVIHQQLFDEDADIVNRISTKVATVDWNAVFKLGFGELTNQGLPLCDGRWVLWLGTGETIAEQYRNIRDELSHANQRTAYRVNHVNDTNTWRRIFCPSAGVRVSGVIHEDLNGDVGPVIARMQDTEKEPHQDPFKNECLRWMKVCAYNYCYQRLLHDHSLLGVTNSGWIAFVKGAKESIEGFCSDHQDLLIPAITGDREGFMDSVRYRMEHGQPAKGVNYNPQGQPMSEGA